MAEMGSSVRSAGSSLGVLFDLDGTLIDTYDIILASFRHTVRTVLGRELPDERSEERRVGKECRL